MVTAANSVSRSSYRAEIDGLRALAVIAVILNHCNEALLRSGFLGVDIFFVISGFVVTSSLATKTNLSWAAYLTGFYSRRITRLVPALLVCVSVTATIGCLFIAFPGTSIATGIMSLFGASSIYLFSQSSDYFSQAAELNLFTHTWSLGVEEQFYIIFSILLALTGFTRRQTQHGEGWFIFWLLTLGTVSYLLYYHFRLTNPSAAFYLMPMRFWELAAGSLIYVVSSKKVFLGRLNPRAATLLSVAALVITFLLLCLPLSVQSLSTTSIVFCTSVLILLFVKDTLVTKFFSCQWMVTIGVLSYSLYLWHWPVLVLARYTIGVRLITIPFLLLVIFALSLVSYYSIERPFRERHIPDIRVIKLGLAASFASALLLLVLGRPFEGLLFTGNIHPPIREPFQGASRNANCRWNYDNSIADNNISAFKALMSDCVIVNKTDAKARTLFITGDSHAQSLGNLALTVSSQLDVNLNLKTAGGCLFPSSFTYITDEYRGMDDKKIRRCQRFQTFRLQELLEDAKPGDIVFNANYYNLYLTSPAFNESEINVKRFDDDGRAISPMQAEERYAQDLLRVAGLFSSIGVRFVVLAPQLQFKRDVNDCTVQWFHFVSSEDTKDCTFKKVDLKTHRQAIMDHFRWVSEHSSLIVWDPIDLLCPLENCEYYDNGNRSYYADRNHYSGDGARFLSNDFISILKFRGVISESIGSK
jgi:peptidoglycan/LPS O-acetylase OafA/YrhL